ncbi:outer membrane protein [Celeribacter sp.]|uniref:outer membrane protein n=1 Tax=Celeribacter sp. TaxID=1890673 RepID=UPI003A8DB040
MSRAIALGLAVIFVATSATAGSYEPALATPAVIAPAKAAVDTSWAGFYGGVSANMMSGEFDTDAPVTGGLPEMDDSTAAGLFVGYNWQINNIVFGGELDYMALDAGFDAFAPGVKQDAVLELRGRLGYSFGNILAYGFVGYAQSEISGPSQSGSVSLDEDGMAYGLGADMLIRDNFLVGLEWSRRELTYDVIGSSYEAGPDVDSISLRLGYKF